jgi:signal transduction histidine kinase
MQEPDTWTELVGIIAHDLKTPITAAKGFIELIKHSGSFNERQDYFSERALSSLRQMEGLVTRLLEIAWIDADRPLEAQDCDLGARIEAAVAMLRDYADKRQVVLHIEIDPDLGSLQADEQRLDNVLTNLISNAIKYNRSGGEVWVRAAGTADNVEVIVRDTGMGIAAEDQPYVFERFFRSSTSRHEKIEGTGLGLSIVKAVIERHGGHIWMESAVDEGSTFAFTLPRVLRQSEGHDEMREAISHRVENAESIDLLREHNTNEEIDAVDDNIQEPPQMSLDRDETDFAQRD